MYPFIHTATLRRARGVVAVAALATSGSAFAQTQAHWLAPADGNWTTAANWSVDPAIPFNGFPNTLDRYVAWVDAAGSPYTVALDFGIDIDGLVLDSADATVHHTAGLLNLNGGALELRQGDYLLDGGMLGNATVTSTGGTFTFGPNATLIDGVGFNQTDLTINAGQTIDGANTISFNGGTLTVGDGGASLAQLEVYGTVLAEGDAAVLLETGRIAVDQRFEVAAGATLRAAGASNSIDSSLFLFNRGTIHLTGADGRLSLSAVRVVNYSTAVIQVDAGTDLSSSRLDNYGEINIGAGAAFAASRLLNRGTISAGAGASLRLHLNSGLASDLGTFDAAGAMVQIDGGLDLEGGSFDLGGADWVFGDRFDRVHNGTITAVNGGTVSAGGAHFEDIVLDADMLVLSGQRVVIDDGVEVTAGHAIVMRRTQAGGSNGRPFLSASSLNGAGELRFENEGYLSGNDAGLVGVDEDPILIGADFTVRTVSADASISSPFINHGTIRAENGTTLAVGSAVSSIGGENRGSIVASSAGVVVLADVQNFGHIEANTFGAIYLEGEWTNAGTILVDTGTLRLDGPFDPTQLNGLTVNSGQVRITGQVDATTDPLVIDGNGNGQGLWVLGAPSGSQIDDASITGTLQTLNGARLVVTETSLFTDFTLNGRIDTIDAHRLRFEGDTTLVNGAEVHFMPGPNTEVRFAGEQSVLGDGALVFDTPNTEAQISLFNTGILTLGSGVTLRTGTGSGRVYAGTLINQGTIRAEGLGRLLDLDVTLDNASTMEALNGGVIQINPLSLNNTGSILMDGGALRLKGSFVITDLPGYTAVNGGQVEVVGNMDLLGQTWNTDGPEGKLVLRDGGTVSNGLVDASNGTPLTVEVGVGRVYSAFTGELLVNNEASAYLNQDAPLDGQVIRINAEASGFAQVVLQNNVIATGTGEVRFEGAGETWLYSIANLGPFTLGTDMTLRALGGEAYIGWSTRETVNHGTIRAENPGAVVHLQTDAPGINTGLIEAQANTAIYFHRQWTNQGTLRLHQSDIATVAEMDLTFAAGSLLRVDWAAPSADDSGPVLELYRDLILGGSLDLVTADGYTPQRGDRLYLADARDALGQFDAVTLDGGAATDLFIITQGRTTSVYFAYLGDATLDGYVGQDDLDLVLANWGSTVTPGGGWALGDVTGDGNVGQPDLQAILDHWGAGSPPSGNVPEPGTLALFALSGLALTRRPRRPRPNASPRALK